MMNEQSVFVNENLCASVIKKITMLLVISLFVLAPVAVNSQYLNTTETAENALTTNPCTDKNHLVLAPGVLKAGGVNRACVSRFYTDGTARLVLTLVSQDRQMTTASRELPPGDGGCLDFNVPQLPNTKADLFAKLFYPAAQCTWERRVVLRVASARVLLAQTERARYRPGDTVRARLLALKPDQAPSHSAIEEVWLEGPEGAWEGTRVTQWQQVRTRLGLAQLQYQLDPLAPPGKWTLRAKLADGSQGSAVFWVGNYELPPFQLSVRHPPRVLRTSDRLVWTVCVRYPWSEAVEGMLVIRLRGAGGGGTGVRTAVQLRAPKACHRHAVAAKRVGLHSQNPPDVLVADFSFQEEGTRIWQNTTVVSQVVEKPVTLEFLTKHRAVLSPGLPHKLKLKATRWDDKPATGERVRVCRHPATQRAGVTSPVTSPACAEGEADAAGLARVMFPALQDDVPFYRFEAFLKSDNTTTASVTVSVRAGTVQAALGPLRAEPGSTRVLVPLYINTDLDTPLTVHFVVVTRGGIIYRWGATTQCPGNNDQIRTAPRHNRCNNHYYAYSQDYTQTNSENEALNQNRLKRNATATQNDPNSIQIQSKFAQNLSQKGIDNYETFDPNSINSDASITGLNLQTKQNTPLRSFSASDAQKYHKSKLYTSLSSPVGVKETENVTVTSDALLDRKLKVMLPIKVSHQMCPDSHLIAYFYYNGELVSAVKHFETTECFANKVEATWLTRQAQPGSTVSLHISSPGPALCAVTVLNTAAKWVQPAPTTKDLLMASLRRLIDTHRNLTEYDAAGDCFLNSDTPEAPTSSMELTSTWLASAGLRVVGGEAPRTSTKRCDAPAPAALVTDDAEPRTDFSEAWLWRVVPLGTNGSGTVQARAPHSVTRYDAAVTCVSRTGIAVAAPATLQVFREFFIHADGPKRLRRGDSAIIRYRVFNYLYEPLSIQIQILTDPHMEVTSDSVESACIGARSSVARRVRVKARVASPARVSLRAKAVRNDSCPNVTATVNVSDEVIIQIIVDPEGVPVQEQKSILLCGNGNVSQTAAQLGSSRVDWSFPRVPAVPGTEALTLWTVGDVTGPLLADADSLVQIPRGCGEQNMAQLATNLLALKHLDPTSIAAFTAKEHVARGFTRQLQYLHPSGGFSAFGPSDVTSSTWLTAFAVKHLRTAHQLLWPNIQVPPALIRAERWLLNQQMENGCFRNEGQVFHRELRGGLNEDGEIANVALTAYVITALIDSTTYLPYHVLRNTLTCLRAIPPLNKSPTSTRVYAHALLAYAYMKIDKYESDLRKSNKLDMNLEQDEGVRQMLELLQVAKRSGGYVWWEANSLSTSIEATSYALLSLAHSPAALRARGASDAAGAGRWLAAHRGPTGGFVSTQDTLVALEALTAWSPTAVGTHLNVTARSGTLAQTVTLRAHNKIPDVMKLTPGEHLTVTVEGTGCALVQATRSYSTVSPAPSHQDKLLSVQVAVHTDGPFDCEHNQTNCFCAAVIEACVVWSGQFPEMALLEVWLPGGFGADAQLLYQQLREPYTLLRRIELSPTNSRATFYLGSSDGSSPLPSGGHQCYNIHAVGVSARTKPAYARVQDYYVPAHNDTQLFTIPEDCPPRISHDTPQYTAADNLYTKARSLDGDEILISHDFSFEDIPDGIPLEDPLYDNLTKKEREETNSDEILEKSIKTNSDDTITKLSDNLNTESVTHYAYQPYSQRDNNFNMFTLNNNENTQNNNHNNENTQYNNHNNANTQNNNHNNENTQNNNDNNENNIPFNKNITQNKRIQVPTAIKPEKITLQSVNNPNLADFHIIDSEKDLDFPTGIEGPIPAVVLPPVNFVPPRADTRQFKDIHSIQTRHGPYLYFNPTENVINRRYFVPRRDYYQGRVR